MSAQYDPNKLGWGFATVVSLVTAGMFYGAYSIHERTYRHPRDPMNVQVYYERDKARAAGEHGGEHGGESHADEHATDTSGEHAEAKDGAKKEAAGH